MIESVETNINPDEHEQLRQKLLWNVKREVKHIMEEAVMKKCIHEDNCSVTTLSSAVEACLLHGLKRRAVGLFKTSTTMALLQKISKTCPSAAEVLKTLDNDSRRNTDSTNIFSFSRKSSNAEDNRRRSIRSAMYNRYLWIRTALIHRSLQKIVEYIVNNSSKYYESYALVANSVQGPIFASLLVGPSAVEFTRLEPYTNNWTDSNANELVQRHRMHSANRTWTNTQGMMIPINAAQSPKFRPRLQLNAKRHASSSTEDYQRTNVSLTSTSNPAKDYVESLHQNAKSQLIYGKNNVLVQPMPGNDPIPGYLSLHLNQNGLTLKWTPNQLMNASNSTNKSSKNTSPESNSFDNQSTTEASKKSSILWDYAISVNMSTIVYVHCHQHVDGDRIVLVGCDGVQYPPLHIKDKGGHLLAFLSCLENGLAPNGQLDPPLCFDKGQGTAFPKLYHRTERQHSSPLSSSEDNTSVQPNVDISDDENSSSNGDYVFRIVFSDPQETPSSTKSSRWHWPTLSHSSQSSLSPPVNTQVISKSLPASPFDAGFTNASGNVESNTDLPKSSSVRTSMASLCDTMRRQILSRAFYGWLAYCRHLKTVRTHLTSLVHPTLIEMNQPTDRNLSLTVEGWTELFISRQNEKLPVDKKEIHRRIYFGGCHPSIRTQVWPFLFSHYSFESTNAERAETDRIANERYHKLISDWQTAEEIVNKIHGQRSSFSKNSTIDSDSNLNSKETNVSPSKTTNKNSLAVFPDSQRKDSNVSNEVFYEEGPIHTVTFASQEQDNEPSNQSVVTARTHTKAVIDRSSPYHIIETNTNARDEDDDDTHLNFKTVDDCNEHMINESQKDKLSSTSSSSVASAVDVYVDAMDVLNDEQSNDLSAQMQYSPFTKTIIEAFSVNLHRIEKDVARCDRNYSYFMNFKNLQKLRNIICTYVWENLTVGYIQGMCDLVAPLLVIFDEEVITYSCFCNLMKRLLPNFPHGTGMDENFGHMRSLLQILDSELYEHIHQTGDFTHFYFCYRWFLLDLKREFNYEDIFLVWEIIAAARRTVSKKFVLFIALAMIKYYRDIILDNRMNFTDIIKFFNETAERHDAQEILRIARELLLEIQKLIDKN